MSDPEEHLPPVGEELPDELEQLRYEYLQSGHQAAVELQNLHRNFLKGGNQLRILREMAGELPAMERLALLTGQRGVAGLLKGLEKFLMDCAERNEAPQPSELRTIGQSVDLLSQLFAKATKDLEFDLHDPLVLVVDDDMTARKTLRYSLEKGSIRPICVGGPGQALDVLQENRFDLFLFDIMMPGMDGYELAERCRKLKPHAVTPLVFVTAAADFQNRVKSISTGASDMIAKPFHMLEIIVKVKTLVLRKQLGLNPTTGKREGA